MGLDFKVLTGSENCYAYWIEGATLAVGVTLDDKPIRQDKFVWLAKAGVSCEKAGSTLTGLENCKVTKEVPCNAGKLSRLNIADGNAICIPTITYEAK